MKTTIELEDRLLREAKATAARRGVTLRRYLSEAVSEKLSREPLAESHPAKTKEWPVPPPVGVTHEEIERIQALIDDEFERIGPLDDDE